MLVCKARLDTETLTRELINEKVLKAGKQHWHACCLWLVVVVVVVTGNKLEVLKLRRKYVMVITVESRGGH